MTLSTADQVRLRIQDQPRYTEEILIGDGTASTFKLAQGSPFSTITAASAFVLLPSPTGWSATGATFNTALGLLTFSGVITANSAMRAAYQWVVFGDDSIGQFTADGGSVAGAALAAVRALQFDSLKRARWSTPDGSSYDDTKAQDTLLKMYDLLWAEVRESPEGGIESWGEEQGNYLGAYNG